jgi:serine-type D-Ala-D-Ala carboxypeptidase (penicillin-binding protein 5/6)
MRYLFLLFFIIVKISSNELDIDLFAKNAVLINAENGKILFKKNANELIYPASTTKMATFLYLIEKHKLNLENPLLKRTITADKEALTKISFKERKDAFFRYPAYWLQPDSFHINIKSQEQFLLKDLIDAMMVTSANDAANVLAKFSSGSINRFMRDMNLFYIDMGLKNTNFCNPHGVHHPKHMTTAHDMALIAKKAYGNEFFRNIVQKTKFFRPKTNLQYKRVYNQSNKLLVNGPYYYPFATGMKTGYTSFAGYCLIASAEYGDRKLIAAVFGCDRSKERFVDAQNLFEAAFIEKAEKKLVLEKENVFQIKYAGASSEITACMKDDINISYFPSENPKIEAFVNWYDKKLPIKKDEIMGEVVIVDEYQKVLVKKCIYAQNKTNKTFLYFLKTLFSKE